MSLQAAKTRHIAETIEQEIGKSEMQKYRLYYNAIRDPRTRTLTTVEFKEHLLAIPKLPITAEELNHMIIQVDLDGNGIIDIDEFVIIMYQSNLDSFLWSTSRRKYSPLDDANTCREKLAVTMNHAKSSFLAMFIVVVIFFFIGLSCLGFCFQTLLIVREYPAVETTFTIIEYVSTVVFTIEFVIRVCIAKTPKEIFGDALMYCDFLSIVPVYIEVILLYATNDAEAVEQSPILNALRVFRLFRLLKLSRYVPFMRTIGATFSKSIVPFAMTLFIVIIYAFIAASLMFFFERGSWSGAHRTWVRDGTGEKLEFESIIDWVFWVFYTILTVGYGQVDVVGGAGQMVGCITAMFGTIVLAVPISIFSSNFNSENQITEAEQIVAFDRETKRLLSKIRTQIEKDKTNTDNSVLVHAASERQLRHTTTYEGSLSAVITETVPKHAGRPGSGYVPGAALKHNKNAGRLSEEGQLPSTIEKPKPRTMVSYRTDPGSFDVTHFDAEALSRDEGATSSFQKTKSGSLMMVSPTSKTARTASTTGKGAEDEGSSNEKEKDDEIKNAEKDFRKLLRARTAKERRSLRSFTTSGTVTDIVARMELEEGDPLVKDIAEIVRKSENRLKMQLRQRHYEFLASVKEEITNVINGVFTVQVGAPQKTKQGQRLITLGVSATGETDEHTQRAISGLHQMDSVLSMMSTDSVDSTMSSLGSFSRKEMAKEMDEMLGHSGWSTPGSDASLLRRDLLRRDMNLWEDDSLSVSSESPTRWGSSRSSTTSPRRRFDRGGSLSSIGSLGSIRSVSSEEEGEPFGLTTVEE